MKENRKLIIKGAILNKNQLENYLEKIASDHILIDKVDKNTYPIPRLKENFFIIKEIYKILNEQIKQGIPIHPAGEWILDNFYIIEEIVKGISKELIFKKYNEFLGLSNGRYKGFARVYVLATEMVAYTDGRINSENLTEMLRAYQSKKTLNMNEIWSIGTFIQIALIENIREICETIYISQMQKYKVEDILSRFLEEEKRRNRIIQINKIGELKDSKDKGAFIEYMSYKLKKLGSKVFPYLNVLEEEVAKTGTNIDEIIKKEHFDIAVKKVSIGNAITSLKSISRINFLEIFERINQVEEILNKDPVKQYEKMDSETKSYYRNEIQELSEETKISEIYIAKKCLELSKKAYEKIQNKESINIKKAHIGYYLISNGKEELLSILLDKKVKLKTNTEKVNSYILGIWSLPFVICLLISFNFYREIIKVDIQNWIKCISAVIAFLIIILPVQNIISKVVQYISSKIVKPKLIPKLDFENGIPEEYSTMVVIPTILKNKEKVRELMKKLEVYYIANKSENLYFTLLGDCTSGDKEVEDFDEEIMNEGIKLTNELNQKYNKIFNFIYRKRIWNEHEDCYMGWERKRGLLNQFNEYLLGHIKDPFRVNTIENDRINNIKYIITLDSDTDLSLKSGLKLVGTMAHILNMPTLNEKEDLVVEGHALIQPRVGVGLLESRNSIFTQVYAGEGGTNSYTNVVSNFYQDNFDEGIFTGKGIYDLNIFSKVLRNEIKENMVLSHDLLEGSYLRCGLASDIMLMDGFPSNYNSFRTRLYRWIRGDYQILPWLKNRIETKTEEKENPLNLLSKYKIFSNIVRSKQEVSVFLSFLFSILVSSIFKVVPVNLIVIGIISIIMPLIVDVINSIINISKENIKTKRFIKTIDGLKASFLRAIIDLLLIPDKMYITMKAEIKTIYRMCKSKKHLLEWVTSEEAEKMSNNDIKLYYKNMMANLVSALSGILIVLLNPIFKIENIMMLNFILIVSILWLVTPAIMYKISKKNKKNNPIEELEEEDKRYLLEIAYKTWLYFKENLNKENNYLVPDNYQEGRKPLIVKRTSSTNIGLRGISSNS